MEQVLVNSRVIKWAASAYYASQVSAALLFFFLPISTSLTSVFFFITLVLVLCSGELFKNIKVIFSEPLVWMLCLFSLMFLLGMFYSHADPAEQFSVMKRYSRYFFCVFLIPVFLTERARRWALQGFLAAGILTLVLVLLKASHVFSFRTAGDTLTIFKTHIDTGFVLVMAAYIALLFSVKTSNKKLKYAYWTFIFFVTITIFYLGYSRSAYLVFFALALLFFFQNFTWRSALVLSGLSLFFIGGMFLSSSVFSSGFAEVKQGYYQFQKVGDRTNMSSGIRLSFYKNGVLALKQHWLLGTGTGSMNYAVSTVEKNSPITVNNLHNEYLNILVQFGVLGLLFLLGLYYCAWRTSFRLLLPYDQLMQGVLLATISGSLINSWLMDSVEGYFFALVLVLCLASALQKQVKSQRRGDASSSLC